VVDDLQWADAATLQLLRLTTAANPALRLYAALRPAEAGGAVRDWIDAEDSTGRLLRVELEPLPGTALAELLQRLAGKPAPHFGAWLHGRTGGNPFFALETLRALFDSGQLRQGAGVWASDLDALSRDYHELQVPPRVAALVRRRVDGLPETTRRALTVAAIAGDAQHLEPLAEVAGLSAWAMADALAAAQAAGLLNGREFAHDLVRDALVRGTPEPLQAVLHAGIARRCAARLPPHRLASHWWAAGDVAAAIDATLDAAAADRLQGQHGAAEARLLDARGRAAGAEQRARLDADRAHTALEGNRLDAAAAAAIDALAGLPLPAVRLQALTVLADVDLLQGRVEAASRQQALCEEIDADAPEVVSLACKLAYHRGRFDDAAARAARRVAELRRQPPGLELVNMLTTLGAAHDGAGRHATAVPCHREALAVVRQLGARYGEVEVTLNLIFSLPELGRHDEAIALGEAALALGDYDATPFLQNNLAWLYLDRGRTDEARLLYRRLACGAEPTLRCYACAKLVQIDAERGDPSGCRAAIDAAFDSLPATEIYSAHAVVLVAIFQHGGSSDAERACGWLRAEALEPSLQQRLDAGLARHGLAPPTGPPPVAVRATQTPE
jgi:tetratricopeptide (TPR) repeat protein